MLKKLIRIGLFSFLVIGPASVSAQSYQEDTERRLLIQSVIVEEAMKYNVDPGLAIFIAAQESDFNPLARSKTSSATGIFQFVNATWKNHCSGNRIDARDNIRCAMKLLAEPKGIRHWTADRVMFRKLFAAGFITEVGLLVYGD